MNPTFAKRILQPVTAALFFCICVPISPAAEATSAKGGALGVSTNDSRKHFTLSTDATWQLEVKGRFDASALTFRKGKLITVNDQDGAVYELSLKSNSVAELKPLPLFQRPALARLVPKRAARLDLEGIALDAAGNLYVSEESQRVVFKSSSDGKNIEALAFDWSPVKKFFSGDPNASLEGIAIAGDRLFLANERSSARIIVLDLPSRKVVDSFFVDSSAFAFGGPHYSDLAFADNHLFILNRNHRCIFEVDPNNKKVVAEYSFARMELAPDFAYLSDYPTGAMEGLAIDPQHFWLLTDNNGKGRIQHPRDTRPTLFRCPRPKPSVAK